MYCKWWFLEVIWQGTPLQGMVISRVNWGKLTPLQETRISLGVQWAGPLQPHSLDRGVCEGLSALEFVPVWRELEAAA